MSEAKPKAAGCTPPQRRDPAHAPDADVIEHPLKIGIGTWAGNSVGIEAAVAGIQANWFYTWSPDKGAASSKFVPQVWGSADMAKLGTIEHSPILAFNEPDGRQQANLTVSQAISYWPRLMALGRPLCSPAVEGPEQAIGRDSWLGQFMTLAAARWYRVDCIAVHYYKDTGIDDFKAFLKGVYEAYRRPVWVTEWALYDWKSPNRYTAEQQARYLIAGSHMMDDLPFVARHAWFAMHDGDGRWAINSRLMNHDGTLTPVGKAFTALVSGKICRSQSQ